MKGKDLKPFNQSQRLNITPYLHTQTHILMLQTKAISRNQACAWLKSFEFIKVIGSATKGKETNIIIQAGIRVYKNSIPSYILPDRLDIGIKFL